MVVSRRHRYGGGSTRAFIVPAVAAFCEGVVVQVNDRRVAVIDTLSRARKIQPAGSVVYRERTRCPRFSRPGSTYVKRRAVGRGDDYDVPTKTQTRVTETSGYHGTKLPSPRPPPHPPPTGEETVGFSQSFTDRVIGWWLRRRLKTCQIDWATTDGDNFGRLRVPRRYNIIIIITISIAAHAYTRVFVYYSFCL